MSEASQFGTTLRLLRVDSGLSVRELARRVGVSSAYLSRVEHGYDAAPTPDRLLAVADALGLPRAALLELARQAGPAVDGYLRRVPAAGALFLDVARRDLDTTQIARVRSFLDREFPETTPVRRVRLSDRLDLTRIVVGFVGTTVRDLVEVAASRLPAGPDGSRSQMVEAILAHEDHVSSCVGGGFIVPHAVVPGVRDAAVLVAMAKPLPISGPDGQPVKVACVIVSPVGGASHLDALTRVARLAAYRVSDQFCAAPGSADLLELLERLEGLW